jgi:hypothetical protein
MRSRKIISLILVFVLSSLSCSLLTPETSSDSGQPADLSVTDFEAPAQPLNVTVELDEAATTSDLFSPSGDVMTLTDADGTVFTLEVPAGALEAETMITMTAVKSIEFVLQ